MSASRRTADFAGDTRFVEASDPLAKAAELAQRIIAAPRVHLGCGLYLVSLRMGFAGAQPPPRSEKPNLLEEKNEHA